MHSPPQQTYNSSRQEGEAVEETLQPQLVRGASRAPLTSAHDNGDPLSVFDDSTLSELSDDEGRYICSMLLRISVPPLSLTRTRCVQTDRKAN